MKADLAHFFAALDAKLAPLAAPEKARLLAINEAGWARHERLLAAWAARDDGSPNPFHPPLDFWTCASARNGLDARLAALRDAEAARLWPPAVRPLHGARRHG